MVNAFKISLKFTWVWKMTREMVYIIYFEDLPFFRALSQIIKIKYKNMLPYVLFWSRA
jgi:hypothetical protein